MYYLRSYHAASGTWGLPSSIEVTYVFQQEIVPSPGNSLTNVCYSEGAGTYILSWTDPWFYYPIGFQYYDVYFGADSLPLTVTAQVTEQTYDCGPILPNTTYYWKVVPHNDYCSEAASFPTWTFTTNSVNDPCYCSSWANDFDESFIREVTYAGINNVSDSSLYTNYSNSTPAIVYQNKTNNLSVRINTNGTTLYVYALIDWNNDHVFQSASERYYLGSSSINNAVLSTNITTPPNAYLDTVKMRIIATTVDYTNTYGCGVLSGGEVEDYSASVLPMPDSPGVPTSNSPGCGSVIITRNAAPPNGIFYYWQTSANGNSTTDSGQSITVSSTGYYYINAYNSNCDCWSLADSIYVVVNSAPANISAGSDTTICTGQSTQLNGSLNVVLDTLYLANNNSQFSQFTNDPSTNKWLYYSDSLLFTHLSPSYPTGSYWMRSPLIDISENMDVNLSFNHEIDWTAGSFILKVQVSTDMVNWTDVWSESVSSDLSVTDVNIDLNSFVDDSFYFRFVFSGYTYNIYYWIIDDILITGLADVEYLWTPSTGLSATNIPNPVASPTATTTYTLIGTTAGCNILDEVTVSVLPELSAGAINTTGENICYNGNPSLIGSITSASGGDNVITYEWRANGVAIPSSNAATYDPPSGLTATTTFTRWAHDGTCNTSWTQSSGSYIVNVQTPTPPTGLLAGDFFWSGEASNSWNTPENWLYYNGSQFSIASQIPSSSDNVFIQTYNSTCATTQPVSNASSSIDVNDVNIQSGLSLGSLSNIRVHGNWNNSGSFIAGTGTVSFVGDTIQQITMGGSAFNNVVVDNTSPENIDISMSDDITINGTLTLNNGILDANGHNLIFGSSATVLANSTSSFVHGKMTKTGSSAFKFPCGDVVSRDLRGNGIPETYVVYTPISATPAASANIEVEYFFTNIGMPDCWSHGGNMDATLHHVSDREYWSVKSSQNLSNITIYWNDNAHAVGDFCTHGFDDGDPSEFVASDLAIAYWSSTMWLNDGGTTTGNHDNGQISSNTTFYPVINTPTIFTFGSRNNLNPLPVELLSFTAQCNEEFTELHWSTASEVNNAFFSIQKSSDSISFEEIARVVGHGNSNSENNYFFTDFNSESNTISYYRLIQFDFDGAENILGTRQSSCNKTDENQPYITVSPNPFDDVLCVVLVNFDSQVSVQIFDQVGQVVWRKSSIETNNLLLKLDELKPGIYYLQVFDKKNICVKKIEKG